MTDKEWLEKALDHKRVLTTMLGTQYICEEHSFDTPKQTSDCWIKP